MIVGGSQAAANVRMRVGQARLFTARSRTAAHAPESRSSLHHHGIVVVTRVRLQVLAQIKFRLRKCPPLFRISGERDIFFRISEVKFQSEKPIKAMFLWNLVDFQPRGHFFLNFAGENVSIFGISGVGTKFILCQHLYARLFE